MTDIPALLVVRIHKVVFAHGLSLITGVPAAAPTLAFIGLLWKSLRNLQFEMQVRQPTGIPFSLLRVSTRSAIMLYVTWSSRLLEGAALPLQSTRSVCCNLWRVISRVSTS